MARPRLKLKVLIAICLAAVVGVASWKLISAPRVHGDVESAKSAMARGEFGRVVAETDSWIGKRAGGARIPQLPEVLLLRGDALTKLGKAYQALYSYEQIIKDHPDAKEFEVAVSRELEIGIALVQGTESLKGREDSKDVGEELLVRATERMPGTSIAERALWELAVWYEREGDRGMATVAYEKYAEWFPRGAHFGEPQQSVRRLKGDVR